MSETVIPIASTPPTRAGLCWPKACCVKNWGTVSTSESTQTSDTLWRWRFDRRDGFMSRLPAQRKFAVLLPLLFVSYVGHTQAIHQMVAHPKRIGHDGERGIDSCARREEAPVHNVEVIDVMGFTVHVQGRCFRVMSKAKFGASAGAPAFSVIASSLPTNEMCPMGYSKSFEPK